MLPPHLPAPTGGAEPWQAQLGAPERGAARSHHSGRHGEQGQDEDPESHGGDQEAPCAVRKWSNPHPQPPARATHPHSYTPIGTCFPSSPVPMQFCSLYCLDS